MVGFALHYVTLLIIFSSCQYNPFFLFFIIISTLIIIVWLSLSYRNLNIDWDRKILHSNVLHSGWRILLGSLIYIYYDYITRKVFWLNRFLGRISYSIWINWNSSDNKWFVILKFIDLRWYSHFDRFVWFSISGGDRKIGPWLTEIFSSYFLHGGTNALTMNLHRLSSFW